MKTESDSRRLAESLVAIGQASGVRTEAVITAMDWPLGLAVGNASEVIEALEVLKGRGPQDLIEVSLELGARMLVMGELAPDRETARGMVRSVIDSGAAVEKFRHVIERQGGDPRVIDDYRRLPAAPRQHVVTAPASGYVASLDAGLIGRASVVLGGGRDRVVDKIDPAAAILIKAPVGAGVRAGDAVLELHFREHCRLDEAVPLVTQAVRIAEQPPVIGPLILGEVG